MCMSCCELMGRRRRRIRRRRRNNASFVIEVEDEKTDRKEE